MSGKSVVGEEMGTGTKKELEKLVELVREVADMAGVSEYQVVSHTFRHLPEFRRSGAAETPKPPVVPKKPGRRKPPRPSSSGGEPPVVETPKVAGPKKFGYAYYLPSKVRELFVDGRLSDQGKRILKREDVSAYFPKSRYSEQIVSLIGREKTNKINGFMVVNAKGENLARLKMVNDFLIESNKTGLALP